MNDTSVRLASVIAQAADMSNPNAAWAAGTSNRAVPRSTSVEYEAANTGRRFAAPPSRRPLGTSSGVTRPLSKTQSATVVPDSEGEDSFDNPLKSVSNLASQALKPFSVYARQRSQEPAEAVNNSYDYSNEERDFQNQNRRKTAQKRGGLSADNKAYKPSMSELDESEDEGSDDGQRRRKSKKKEAGRVNTLPTIGESKQRKKRKRGPRVAGQPESEEEEENEPSSLSLENPLQPLRNTSVHPQPRPAEDSMDIDTSHDTSLEEPRAAPRRAASVGATLGKSINTSYKGVAFILNGINSIFSGILWLCGRVLGTILNTIFKTPATWLLRGSLNGLLSYLIIGLTLAAAWHFLREPLSNFSPSFPGRGYRPPEKPAADISEFNTRLLDIENTLKDLVTDSDRLRSKVDSESRSTSDIAHKITSLEKKVQHDAAKAAETEEHYRSATNNVMAAMRKELEILQAQMQSHSSSSGTGSDVGTDEEARARLKALENRLASAEGSVKEALDVAKNVAKTGSAAAGLSWLERVGKKGLTVKSSDGKDVTGLIEQMVRWALFNDVTGKTDWALYTGGGRIHPRLNDDRMEIATDYGAAKGPGPSNALHPDLSPGMCFAMSGSSGQLGVILSRHLFISEVTVDHIPSSVAQNIATAPRAMEVWGLVDDKSTNLAKVEAWRADKAGRRAQAVERGEAVPEEVEEVYPREIAHGWFEQKSIPDKLWVKLSSFSYNIYSPNHIQTFPVDEEVKALGVDFGIVVLMVKNNWGHPDHTCLYRFRVHGEPHERPPPALPQSILDGEA